jgi:hypothetical protein
MNPQFQKSVISQCLKYGSRHADHTYICKYEHLKKVYTPRPGQNMHASYFFPIYPNFGNLSIRFW